MRYRILVNYSGRHMFLFNFAHDLSSKLPNDILCVNYSRVYDPNFLYDLHLDMSTPILFWRGQYCKTQGLSFNSLYPVMQMTVVTRADIICYINLYMITLV